MISNYSSDIKTEPTHNLVERWLKKLFRWKSKDLPTDPDIDRRDFYRLEVDSQNPLDLCLTMQDERVFCTSIRDLSASGFSCHIEDFNQAPENQSLTAFFILPLEEPFIIKTEVYLVSVLKGDTEHEDLFRFCFSEEIKDEDRDRVHRYIVQKQFEALEKTNKENTAQYYEDYPEALTRN